MEEKKPEEMLSKQLNVLISAVSMTNLSETKAISKIQKKKNQKSEKKLNKWPIDRHK